MHHSLTCLPSSNLLDTEKLKEYLDFEAHRHVNTDSDSEIMLQVFASQLLQTDKRRVDEEDLFTGLGNMLVEYSPLSHLSCFSCAKSHVGIPGIR